MGSFKRAAKLWLKFKDNLKLNPKIADDKNLWDSFGGKNVVRAFANLAFIVLQTRQVPIHVKNFTQQVKPFTSARHRPQDVRKFFRDNRRIMFLLLSASKWPRLSEGISVGGFTLLNPQRLLGLTEIAKLITSVSQKIKQSGLRDAPRVLYGDILLTRALLGRREQAFYRRREDSVWIRPNTKWGPATEHVLSHELGHRYWTKFFRGQLEWEDWDRKAREQVEKAGSVRRYFPTEYAFSSGDAEENFAESFALRVLDRLKEPLLTKFEEIVS